MPANRNYPVGSIWTFRDIENGQGIVLLGPFAGIHQLREYVVVPLYMGTERDFGWTDQDVRLEAHETRFDKPAFLGVWNAQMALENDFDQLLLTVPDAMLGVALAQDVYWAASQDRGVRHARLGPPLVYESRTSAFHLREITKWGHLSLHALEGRQEAGRPSGDTAP